jgi:pilus assembly protein Flp/PilA
LPRIVASDLTARFIRIRRFTYAHSRARTQAGLFARGAIPTGERIQVTSQLIGRAGNLLWKFLANERGVSALEYGLLAAGIAVAIIATVAALGTNLNATFSSVSSSLN